MGRPITVEDLEIAVEVLRVHPSTAQTSYEAAVQFVAALREVMSDRLQEDGDA